MVTIDVPPGDVRPLRRLPRAGVERRGRGRSSGPAARAHPPLSPLTADAELLRGFRVEAARHLQVLGLLVGAKRLLRLRAHHAVHRTGILPLRLESLLGLADV